MDEIKDDALSIPNRIKSIYKSCSPIEQQYLLTILQELSESNIGYSKTYEEIWLADYKEIPVDINTFLDSDTYLGKTNRQGKAVYPFWRKELNTVFNAGNKYNEWVLTGATRIGKSSTAIAGMAYMLYRLMCLKDPQKFFGKKDISKFSFLFFNITKDLAKGVAFREFNDSVHASPWFQQHGSFSKSEQNFYYIPEGDKIIVTYGSSGANALGQQVFCVVGNTCILTDHGVFPISDLAGKKENLAQYDYVNGKLVYADSEVQFTKYTTKTIKIEFEDGSVFECTPEHKVLLNDRTYRQLCDITENDELFTFNLYSKIKHITTIEYKKPIPVYDVINAIPNNNFIGVSKDTMIVFHNCAIMDECNFSQSGIKDVNKAKERMQDTYNTISARIKGTFKHGGEVFGKLFAVSSKRGDSDFMEAYVQRQLDSGAGEHMHISDAPQWEVLPKGTFSDKTFYIAVGNRNQRGFVIPDNQCFPEALEDLKTQGYKILQPPLDMRPDFIADFHIALRDLAGIAVVGALSFITQESLTQCINTSRRNPFYSDIVTIGTKDDYMIEEFFHMNEVDPAIKKFPIFIHLDLSKNTDRTGISGGCVCGRKDITDASGNTVSLPIFHHIFTVAVEAPRGDCISYAKIVEFICWLRKSGLDIRYISRDQFQSEYVGQQLESKGFQVDLLSLDRKPDGYIALRSVLTEQRVDMLDHKLLQDELVHLQRDSVTGKCDHPAGGCFHGDTKVILADGSRMSMTDLYFSNHMHHYYVKTINESTGDTEFKPIEKVFITKTVEHLMLVQFSNGKQVLCTEDHRFMLCDNTYLPVQEIPLGTELKTDGLPICLMSKSIISISCPVYDMSVKDNHNFFIDSGVCVHNSKDAADSFAGWIWNAILHNPEVKIPAKKIASTISAINQKRSGAGARLPSMFPHINIL